MRLVCGEDATISDVEARIEQCPNGNRNLTPSGVLAWIFLAGSTLKLEWDYVVRVAQQRMLDLVARVTETSGRRQP
jgi:hypothetical protein